jgi:hypothetical protein
LLRVRSAALADGPIKADKYYALYVLPVPLQIPEPVMGQQNVLFVPLVCIHYRRTLNRVRPAILIPVQMLLGQQSVLKFRVTKDAYKENIQTQQVL